VISVLQLGRIDYAAGLRIQQELVELRKAGRIGDVLLLLEHTPVITLGRNAKTANVLLPPDQLALRGVEVFECDRGGDVTFHGPGQLVGYPIFDLRGYSISQLPALGSQERPARKTMGAIDYVRRLEEALIRTCADFSISTKRVAGLTGVWTQVDSVGPGLRPGQDGSETRPHTASPHTSSPYTEGKIAAIGVHISRSVTSHGFALNVNTDLSYFSLIVPCGITSKPVTSMKKELEQEVNVDEVAQSVRRNFSIVFGEKITPVASLDALLENSVGVPMKAPESLRAIRGEEDLFLA
jgi:lipoyl(octanoyl) transferase